MKELVFTSKDISTPDRRMIELLDHLLASGAIRYRQEFLDTIGMLKQNLRKVTEGTIGFTPEQIASACETYKVNANWIFGLEKQMMRK